MRKNHRELRLWICDGEDLNYETIQEYRNRHRTLKPGHPFERLNDAEYLRSIGVAVISRENV